MEVRGYILVKQYQLQETPSHILSKYFEESSRTPILKNTEMRQKTILQESNVAKLQLKKFRVSCCFPILMSCNRYTIFFPLGGCYNAGDLAWAWQLCPEMSNLIIKSQTNVEINNWKSAKIPFHPCSILEKMFISKENSFDNQHI